MSNIAKGILIANRALINNNNSVYTSTTGLCFRIDEFTTLADFKAYLAEQYSNGTPVEVEYELANEVIEQYTEAQQTAYNQIKALRTYKNVTHMSGDAKVEMTYVQDTKTYINNIETRLEALESEG